MASDKSQAIKQRFNRVLRKLAINNVWLDARPKVVPLRLDDYKEINELSENDIKLINIPHALRTVEERKQVVKIFTDLGCLLDFPPKIRARLSRVMHFAEYKPETLLFTEQSKPLLSYVLISGKVDTYHTIYNARKKRYEKHRDMINIFGSGTFLGNYSIYWNSTRRNSSASISSVDTLIINASDLLEIVYPFWKNHFEEKMKVIRTLPYFGHFNETQVIEACKLSTLRQYNVYETIYTQDEGNLSDVYFVVSGECMIVQNLRVIMQKKKGKLGYKLAEDTDEDEYGSWTSLDTAILSDPNYFDEADVDEALRSEHSQLFDIRSAFNKCGIEVPDLSYLNMPSVPKIGKKDEGVKSVYRYFFGTKSDNSLESERDVTIKVVKQTIRKSAVLPEAGLNRRPTMRLPSYYDQPKQKSPEHTKKANRTSFSKDNGSSESITSSGMDIDVHEGGEDGDNYKYEDDDVSDMSSELGYVDYNASWNNKRFKSLSDIKRSRTTINDEPIYFDRNSSFSGSRSSTFSAGSSVFSFSQYDKPETHLIDVGTIRVNGIFGLGEKSTQRFIIARSNVQVLTLPRFWLMQRAQNTNGVWRVRRQMIEKALPTRERIFEIFLKEREWPKFKNKYVESVLDPDSIANGTQRSDIPGMLQI